MALFRIPSGVATQVRALPSHPEKERGLQRLIERNLEPLFGVRFVATEFNTGQKHRGRIDTLGLDQDGSPVIIEYKLTSHDNVMNQGLFYLDWLMDHKGDFEVKARSTLGEASVAWAAPRLILLAAAFSRFDQYAVNRIDDQIELWTYKLYEGDLLSVERLSAEEVPSPKSEPAPQKSPAGRHKSARPAYDLAHHLAKMSPDRGAVRNSSRRGHGPRRRRHRAIHEPVRRLPALEELLRNRRPPQQAQRVHRWARGRPGWRDGGRQQDWPLGDWQQSGDRRLGG
ncbi:MAG: hypothetical protein H0T66_17675 [Geodermatophilaceae bacterium]|nr:hypothetical protein [Geodermatophilaceae bacterium]